jgi:hypothetical protein
MLVAGLFAATQFSRNQERGIQGAIERHLDSVLSELESLEQSGRFPSVQLARKALNDEAIAKRVHVTSLFGTGDLFYNPSQPLVGGNALVVCARVGGRLVAIYADRKVQNLGQTEFQQARLVPLAGVTTQNQAVPRSQTNGTSR